MRTPDKIALGLLVYGVVSISVGIVLKRRGILLT